MSDIKTSKMPGSNFKKYRTSNAIPESKIHNMEQGTSSGIMDDNIEDTTLLKIERLEIIIKNLESSLLKALKINAKLLKERKTLDNV